MQDSAAEFWATLIDQHYFSYKIGAFVKWTPTALAPSAAVDSTADSTMDAVAPVYVGVSSGLLVFACAVVFVMERKRNLLRKLLQRNTRAIDLMALSKVSGLRVWPVQTVL
jgi:hypothetical protein